MKKLVAVLGVLVLLALGGFVGYRVYLKLGQQDQAGGGPGRGGAVPVEVTLVVRTTLRDVGRFTGSLVPDSRFIVAARVPGRLVRLLVNLGDPVSRGQVVAQLDDNEYVQQLERAKADLLVAQASMQECQTTLESSRRELERAEALRQKKIASESEYDKAKTDCEVQESRGRVATAQVDQKQAAMKEADIRLSYTRIAADWDGGTDTRYVGERFVDEGALLAANSPIVSVIDISTLTAVIYVIERDYSRIAIGQEAMVGTDAFPGRTFTGRIVRIAPQLQETSRQARVELTIANAQLLLKPGMFVRVQLELSARENTPAIPVSALARRNGNQGVFVADLSSHTARFVPLELGISAGQLVEVLSPELDGPVVTMGQHLLEDGGAIRLPAESTATAPAEGSAAPADATAQRRGNERRGGPRP